MKLVLVWRKLLRHVPILSRLARALDSLENENQQLREALAQARHLQSEGVLQSEITNSLTIDGVPLPPPLYRNWVAGTDDADWFLEGGKLGAQTILELLSKQQVKLDQLDSLLDFGCGCGRVIRHLRLYEQVKLHGTDYNKAAIAWCDENLSFAEFGTNLLEPPTRYRNHSFDLIYAFSVFTHLTETLQMAWMDELHRILKPNGYLIITVHGDFYLSQLSSSEKTRYQQGGVIVSASNRAGQNDCAAFHPESYVRNVLAYRFDVIDFVPQGALGNPKQDAYLLSPRGQ